MERSKNFMKKKITLIGALFFLVFLVLMGRLVYLMVFQSQYYSQKAEDIEERERDIKAARGRLIDANGKILATNETVCTVSVIHSQITDADAVTDMLVKELGLTEEEARKRVEKVSSIERVKTNVPKETGDAIRAYDLDGVKVDEDYRRYYPYDELASKVLGFTGGDNQGIVGLEVRYEEYLKGINGTILTLTKAEESGSDSGEEVETLWYVDGTAIPEGNSAFSSLFAQLSSLELESYWDYRGEADVLSACGLMEPVGVLCVKDGEEEVLTLTIGSLDGTGESYYVQRSGDPAVYLLPADSVTALVELTAEQLIEGEGESEAS